MLLYFAIWGLDLAFPYLTTGATVILNAKLHDEAQDLIFPRGTHAIKIAMFGDSRILAGLRAKQFDALANADGLNTYTYDAGLPGRGDFVPELKTIVSTGNAPDVILLTLPWAPYKRHSVFSLPIPDHELATVIFPFHSFLRDTSSFVATARGRGGIRTFYRLSSENAAKMREDRGYYFISEQSHYANDSLPDDFKYPGDQPDVVNYRTGDPASQELTDLNDLLTRHSIVCLYVPNPVRLNSAAEAPPVDENFERLVTTHTPCKVIGPDYLRYPNRYFSDQVHMNRVGSQIYTEELYRLVKISLSGRQGK